MDRLHVRWVSSDVSSPVCETNSADRRYDAMIPCYYQMPTYLEKTGYKNPIDPEDGVFQYTKGWKGNLFAYYDAHEREGKSFNNMMGAVMANQASWLDIYPHQTLLDADGDHTAPLLVDVGGSVGHDIERFRQAHPEAAARLVLQDRAEVVKLSKCPDPVKKMAYDFFTPQPVRGTWKTIDWGGNGETSLPRRVSSLVMCCRSPRLLHARRHPRLVRWPCSKDLGGPARGHGSGL